MSPTRSVLVEAHRLEGWLSRFRARNGMYTVGPDTGGSADSLRIVASNGCTAVLTPPLPRGLDVVPADPLPDGRDAAPEPPSGGPCTAPTPPPGPPGADRQPAAGDAGSGPIAAMLGAVDTRIPVGLLLLRRGGYSVGVARDGRVVSSKTGTRYVQGRTAAGGWSQQRFARRRANQAASLVEETAVRAAALFVAEPPSCLQLGGDRTLTTLALAEPVLKPWAGLPQTPFLTVPDPRFAVLEEAAKAALSIRITVTDPPEAG
ncbi:hypothetical protein E8P82_06265 [Arthrobacter echini]|uniref:Actinobacteria/chloroflexi VLRF1 release factor domain-containing protein n=1 Tax=Arthrobacter echini TaxID=1529066 RepID=A0A4S5E661_9MICC|nr:acVLRF1 family peptidyl-tRNA hydrolase [Arthrobacter echini]THJ67045.1 hypothetical protein E8P82_06265 [Arthrobacter echini]